MKGSTQMPTSFGCCYCCHDVVFLEIHDQLISQEYWRWPEWPRWLRRKETHRRLTTRERKQRRIAYILDSKQKRLKREIIALNCLFLFNYFIFTRIEFYAVMTPEFCFTNILIILISLYRAYREYLRLLMTSILMNYEQFNTSWPTLWSSIKVVGSVWSDLLVGITRWPGLWLSLLLLLAVNTFALLMNGSNHRLFASRWWRTIFRSGNESEVLSTSKWTDCRDELRKVIN